jgi:PAS domain S-box-containing protein
MTADGEVLLALQKQTEFFRNAFEYAAIGMALVAPDGQFLDVNASLCRIVGYSKEELLQRDFQSITHPDDLEADLHQVERMLRKEIDTYQMEKRYFHKSGEIVWVLLSVSLVCDEQGAPKVFISQIEDITECKRLDREQREMQARLQRAELLESLAVLAGGVAHDFNNILVGILGNASLALEQCSPTSPVHGRLEQIERSAMRAADLTRQLLAYSGKGRFVLQRFDLSELVRDMADLLRSAVPKNASLQFRLAPRPIPVEADATQIRQVVMNLAMNGAEALGGRRGVVSISTGVLFADRDLLRASAVDVAIPEGDYAFLEVADDGDGMDAHTQTRIFEPFFTTKTASRGLGLAAVLGIVRSHRGAVFVRSAPGDGAAFQVLLPLTHGRTESLVDPRGPEQSWTGAGVVLVVDDERTVRDVAKTILEAHGLTVLVAASGPEGLETFRARPDSIDLVLLDVTMSGFDGERTLRELRAVRADVPVILSSGWREQDSASLLAQRGEADFLPKPYRAPDLLAKVRAALARRPRTGARPEGSQ